MMTRCSVIWLVAFMLCAAQSACNSSGDGDADTNVDMDMDGESDADSGSDIDINGDDDLADNDGGIDTDGNDDGEIDMDGNTDGDMDMDGDADGEGDADMDAGDEADHCVPDCGDRECGMDPVCGTLSCGVCGDEETCEAGFCVSTFAGSCDCLSSTGICTDYTGSAFVPAAVEANCIRLTGCTYSASHCSTLNAVGICLFSSGDIAERYLTYYLSTWTEARAEVNCTESGGIFSPV